MEVLRPKKNPFVIKNILFNGVLTSDFIVNKINKCSKRQQICLESTLPNSEEIQHSRPDEDVGVKIDFLSPTRESERTKSYPDRVYHLRERTK